MILACGCTPVALPHVIAVMGLCVTRTPRPWWIYAVTLGIIQEILLLMTSGCVAVCLRNPYRHSNRAISRDLIGHGEWRHSDKNVFRKHRWANTFRRKRVYHCSQFLFYAGTVMIKFIYRSDRDTWTIKNIETCVCVCWAIPWACFRLWIWVNHPIFVILGPLLLTWFNSNPSTDK